MSSDLTKHAYLIMAHNNFEELKMLIEVLDHRRTDIYIHIDKRANFIDFDSLRIRTKHSYVDIYSEFSVYWGDYSQSLVEISLLERAHAHDQYEYYHLISNADFPTKPQDEILSFFDENKNKEFISFRFPLNIWPFNNKIYSTEHKYYHVLTKYLRTGHNIRDHIVYFIEYFCVFLQFLFRVDRIKGEFVSAKGSQWWSITNDFAEYVLSKKDWLNKHFRMARSGDEAWPAILVYNSVFRDRLYDKNYDCSNNANQRYIDWERGFPRPVRRDAVAAGDFRREYLHLRGLPAAGRVGERDMRAGDYPAVVLHHPADCPVLQSFPGQPVGREGVQRDTPGGGGSDSRALHFGGAVAAFEAGAADSPRHRGIADLAVRRVAGVDYPGGDCRGAGVYVLD